MFFHRNSQVWITAWCRLSEKCEQPPAGPEIRVPATLRQGVAPIPAGTVQPDSCRKSLSLRSLGYSERRAGISTS